MPDTNYIIQGETLTDIADAIRNKKGSNNLIDAADMATEIDSIPTGSSIPTPCIELADYEYASGLGNGTYLPTKLVFNGVTGNVPFQSSMLSGFGNSPFLNGINEIELKNIDKSIMPTQIYDSAWVQMRSCIFPEGINEYFETVTNGIGQQAFNQFGMNRANDQQIILRFPNIASDTEGMGAAISNNSFQYCNVLKKIYIGQIGKYMGQITGAFKNCSSLKKVFFLSKPYSINATSTFQGTSSVTDIYVSWAEGEVSGAPWGATNATIHYNYTQVLPELDSIWLGYDGASAPIDIVNDSSMTTGSILENGKYRFSLDNVTLPEAISSSIGYGWDIDIDYYGNVSKDSSGAGPHWVSDGDFNAWVFQQGPTTINVITGTETGLNAQVEVIYDPNWQPPVSIPTLTTYKMGASQEGDMVNLTNLSVNGELRNSKYVYRFNNVNLTNAITSSGNYIFNVATSSGMNIGTAANASWVNDGTATGWVFHPSNSALSEVFITVTSQSDTVAQNVEVRIDPNWSPNPTLTSLTVESPVGTQIYNNSSLNVSSENNRYWIGGSATSSPLDFGVTLAANDSVNVIAEFSDGSRSGMGGQLSEVTGTPSYLYYNVSQGPIGQVRFYSQGNNYYDVELRLNSGGEN